MKILQINEDWRICQEDQYNVSIQKRRVSKPGPRTKQVGREYWDSKGYYGDWSDALEALPDKIIMGSEVEELKQAIAGFRADVQKLASALPPEGPPEQV